MADINDASKYLGITPAGEATDALAGATKIAHRPSALNNPAARKFGKIQYNITVPAHTKVGPQYSVNVQSFVAFQYNYTASRAFKLAYNGTNNVKLSNGSMAIKFRIGTTVYRYFIGGNCTTTLLNGRENLLDPVPGWKMYNAEVYAGQTIQPNFVIELWSVPRIIPFFSPGFVQITSDIVIGTSLFAYPSSYDEQSRSLAAPALVEPTLYVALPEAIPTNYTDTAWLTN